MSIKEESTCTFCVFFNRTLITLYLFTQRLVMTTLQELAIPRCAVDVLIYNMRLGKLRESPMRMEPSEWGKIIDESAQGLVMGGKRQAIMVLK